jgi:hypothetical protein
VSKEPKSANEIRITDGICVVICGGVGRLGGGILPTFSHLAYYSADTSGKPVVICGTWHLPPTCLIVPPLPPPDSILHPIRGTARGWVQGDPWVPMCWSFAGEATTHNHGAQAPWVGVVASCVEKLSDETHGSSCTRSVASDSAQMHRTGRL